MYFTGLNYTLNESQSIKWPAGGKIGSHAYKRQQQLLELIAIFGYDKQKNGISCYLFPLKIVRIQTKSSYMIFGSKDKWKL